MVEPPYEHHCLLPLIIPDLNLDRLLMQKVLESRIESTVNSDRVAIAKAKLASK